MKKKVLIPTKLDPIACCMLEEQGDYQVLQEEGADLSVLAAAHPDTYALIVRSEKVDATLIDALPALKVVIRAGAGYNTIDTRYARERGVDVMNTPGANSNAVAEEVVAMMLADLRHIVRADGSCRAGKWEKSKLMGRELTHKTVGIVGLGHIGQLVARRLAGFEVRLMGYDPMISEERARELGVELADLPRLFSACDFISLHIPENDNTRGLINRELLEQMPEGATLVNCARAGVIHEEDLRAVKAERGIRFLNDVYAKDVEGDKSVADIADLMLPHLGASTREANQNAARLAAKELVDFDVRGITSCIVNRDIPEGLNEAYGELAYTLASLCRKVLGEACTLKQVQTSIYGGLQPYGDWLLVPMCAAWFQDFDRSKDHLAAQAELADRGIEYRNRDVDERKGYGDSITVDLIGGSGPDALHCASVRGTVTEGNLMVSRINGFHKLYFEPKGHIAVFIFKDRPGVLGQIAAELASAEVNIDDVRNPHDTKGDQSIAILKVNREVPREVIDHIRKEIEATTAFHLFL